MIHKNIIIENGAYASYTELFEPIKGSKINLGDLINLIEEMLLKKCNNPEFKGKEHLFKFPEHLKEKYFNYGYDYNELDEGFSMISRDYDLDLLNKRGYGFVPLGTGFEERVARLNPSGEQVTGELDYMGKIDFIDHDKKIIYTVKASKQIAGFLFKQIRDYLNANNLYKDYDIALIGKNTAADMLPVMVINEREGDLYE